jgi:integral membrane sensor domain MASE1
VKHGFIARQWRSPDLVIWILLCGAYFLAGKLGLKLAFVHENATAVWPPTGIAIAASLILGYRVWPGIFLGAFLVNITTQGSIATSIGIAAGNTLEGVVAAYLASRFAGGRRAFNHSQDLLKFVVLAGIVSPTVSATLGVTSLSLGGYAHWSQFGSIWLTWWLGDVGGALLVAPALVLWRESHVRWNTPRLCEAGCLLLALGLVGQMVFGGWFPGEVKNYELTYLCLPLLVWAAFRFGPREAAIANLVLSQIAIWGTLRGYGPFARVGSPNESLLLLQAFMAASAVFDMTLAAVVSERRRVEGKREMLLRELQHTMETVHSLPGLLSICAACRKVRNDHDAWEKMESYVEDRWGVRFTHGLCPECFGELYR